ncbi:MAG TPA: hypothetical protein VFH61_13845 [Thermoleophilia bacterium]|nr:hypothetical protein [Thermoleophilia bacterium]
MKHNAGRPRRVSGARKEFGGRKAATPSVPTIADEIAANQCRHGHYDSDPCAICHPQEFADRRDAAKYANDDELCADSAGVIRCHQRCVWCGT